jgi:hypothetical protein
MNTATAFSNHQVLQSLCLASPTASFPVEVIQWKKSLAVNGYKLDSCKNELEFLVGHVAREAHSCPSWLCSNITLEQNINISTVNKEHRIFITTAIKNNFWQHFNS